MKPSGSPLAGQARSSPRNGTPLFVRDRTQQQRLVSSNTPGSASRDAWNEASSVTSDGASSAVSVTSSYRHHHGGPFMSPQSYPVPQTPLPVLVKDAQHKPKTLGSFGVLVVGLGGANGTTMLAGVLANRLGRHWYGPKGEPMTPNYYGCITQLQQKGVHGGVGYKDRVKGLADASMAAIGGWVRSVFRMQAGNLSLSTGLCVAALIYAILVPLTQCSFLLAVLVRFSVSLSLLLAF